nr:MULTISPECIES: pilin [Halomonas]
MNHKQQGFTLIELMIVVAIIGILAAIAIPQYQDYIARTQVNRAYGEISALKTATEESMNRGQVPGDAASLGFTSSTLMTSVPSVNENSGAVSISATLGNDAAIAVSGTTITLNRTASGVWSCDVGTGSANSWDESYMPTGCE